MNWPMARLGDVATELTVGFVGTMADQYVEAGVRFLRSQDITPYRILTNENRFISEEFHSRISKSRLTPGDVVIVRTGKPGTCAIVPDGLGECNCSDLVIVRPGPNLNPRYLSYYINGVASHHVDAFTVGAVQQHFNVGGARELRFPFPPIEVQDEIAAILGSLDDKIELNRRMNETLEAMARAIFKSWFIDFDPVRIKARGGDPTAELGLSPEIAALFPDSFQDSELGEIPLYWDVRTIGEVCGIVGGGTPSTAEPSFWDGPFSWVTPRDMSRLDSPILLSTERTVTKEGLDRISSGLLSPGTVLMSSRAPIGYLAITRISVAINQGFIALKPQEAVGSTFLLQWCQQNMDLIKDRANGSTFMEISKSNFRPMLLVAPPREVLTAFAEETEPLYELIASNLIESGSLAETRDYLLPRLLSGTTEVKREVEP